MSNENDPETPEVPAENAVDTPETAPTVAEQAPKVAKRKLTPEQEANMRVYGRKEG